MFHPESRFFVMSVTVLGLVGGAPWGRHRASVFATVFKAQGEKASGEVLFFQRIRFAVERDGGRFVAKAKQADDVFCDPRPPS